MFRSKAFIGQIYTELTDRYGPSYLWSTANTIPKGLRLELGYQLYHFIRVDPDLWYMADMTKGEGYGLESWFRVPTQLNRDLRPSAWRLVVVTEEVLTEDVAEGLDL